MRRHKLILVLAAMALAACTKPVPEPQPPVKQIDPVFVAELAKAKTPEEVYNLWGKAGVNSLEAGAAKNRLSELVIPLIKKSATLAELEKLRKFVRPGTMSVVDYGQRETDLRKN